MAPKKYYKKLILVSLIIISCLFLTGASSRIIESGRSLIVKLKIFSEIIDHVRKNYVEETDPQKLIDHAIRGMITNLDPHTSYLTRDQFKRMNQNYAGYSGIGITFDIIRNKITVLSVIPNGPSDIAGLHSGDRIIAINDESAIGITREEAPLKLMGPKRTKVKVTIERKELNAPRDIVITRDEVHLGSINYVFMLRNGVGYIKIDRFTATTGKEMEKNLKDLRTKGMNQLILDLRGNEGGYLGAAVEVADKFLPSGKKIVYTKGRTRQSFQEYYSTSRATFTLIPMVVLIDKWSASAAEIVAGALQDWDRSLILGETSFGKALVLTPYKLNDGSALLMTTARYYTPSGRMIQRPYTNKSIEAYYEEITNDSLRTEWERDPSRPAQKTLILKRRVLGGGGITPDVFLSVNKDRLSPIMLRMRNSRQRLFYTFVEEYLKTKPELKIEFNDFLRNYKPNGAVLEQFLRYIRKQGFKISNEEFVQNKQDIQFMLKQTIANEIWGSIERYKVFLLRDHQLVESLNYITESEALLNKAYLTTGNP